MLAITSITPENSDGTLSCALARSAPAETDLPSPAPFVPALSRDVSRAQSPSAINWDDLIQTMDLGMLPTFNFLDQGTNDPFAFLDGTL